MLTELFPQIYIKSIYELPLKTLKERSIRAIAFDIDNTVAPYDIAEPDDRLIEFFKNLTEQGFKLIILSNNNKRRVELFNQKLGATAIYKAGKPGTKKLRSTLESLGVDPKHAALVGDQIFTDVWCGNRAGVLSVLTAPICNRDQLVTKVKRGLESQILKIYFKKAGIK